MVDALMLDASSNVLHLDMIGVMRNHAMDLPWSRLFSGVTRRAEVLCSRDCTLVGIENLYIFIYGRKRLWAMRFGHDFEQPALVA